MNNSKEKGSFEAWNSIWESQSSSDIINKKFTLKAPQSIYQFWQQVYAMDLIDLIKNKKYQKFCELGAGRGTTTMYLAQEGYSDLTMVDLAKEGFEIAANSFSHYGLKQPQMILADVEKSGLLYDFYDCIYNIGLLEHFIDPSKTLQEAYNLLKKNGLIFMPIVPELPVSKSLIQRFFFNPISLLKIAIKFLLNIKKPNEDTNMTRTDYDKQSYIKICEKIGYKNVKCIAYNPYWKVNNDGWFENNITFPIYLWHYNTFKKGKALSFTTHDSFELCYLLIAEK
jgi:2-polyprenyl-3-methyl-5-hydroxy-6-metoxy-1,4-benzoquinol methylase